MSFHESLCEGMYMREYEVMIITKPDVPEGDLAKMMTKWEGIMGEEGGQIIKKEAWGIKRLAYPIAKQSRGHYTVYDVSSSQKNMKELDRVLRLDESVLRPLIIKLNEEVDVEARKIQLQQQAEEAVRKAAEAARDRTEGESLSARRGGSLRDEE